MIPTLNGEKRKIKVCAGTVLAQFDSTGNAQIPLAESFIEGNAVVNFLSTDALVANAGVLDNILGVQVYANFANARIYVKYIVIGY